MLNSEMKYISTDFIQTKYDEKLNSTDPTNLSMDIYKTFIGLSDLKQKTDGVATLFQIENAPDLNFDEMTASEAIT